MVQQLVSHRKRTISGDVYHRPHDDTYSIGGDSVDELFWEALKEVCKFPGSALPSCV